MNENLSLALSGAAVALSFLMGLAKMHRKNRILSLMGVIGVFGAAYFFIGDVLLGTISVVGVAVLAVMLRKNKKQPQAK